MGERHGQLPQRHRAQVRRPRQRLPGRQAAARGQEEAGPSGGEGSAGGCPVNGTVTEEINSLR